MEVSNSNRPQVFIVVNFTDNSISEFTKGTLRHAITNAQNNEFIFLKGVTPGETTITLATVLPNITRNITIEGNGITLTRSWADNAATSTSHLIKINPNTVVNINRVHFFNGRVSSTYVDGGGAIHTSGDLSLESCIFSNNRAINSFGGAIFNNSGLLTIKGCTFINNGGYGGGAIFVKGNLNFYGNIFHGNTSSNGTNVMWPSGGTIRSQGYNVVDKTFGMADGTDPNGFTAATGDATFAPISGSPNNVGFSNNITFPFDGTATTTTFTPRLGNSPANNTQLRTRIPASGSWTIGGNTVTMPSTDFYGNLRKWTLGQSGAPGAVESP